jgi:hypothetical protein
VVHKFQEGRRVLQIFQWILCKKKKKAWTDWFVHYYNFNSNSQITICGSSICFREM